MKQAKEVLVELRSALVTQQKVFAQACDQLTALKDKIQRAKEAETVAEENLKELEERREEAKRRKEQAFSSLDMAPTYQVGEGEIRLFDFVCVLVRVRVYVCVKEFERCARKDKVSVSVVDFFVCVTGFGRCGSDDHVPDA